MLKEGKISKMSSSKRMQYEPDWDMLPGTCQRYENLPGGFAVTLFYLPGN